MADDDNRDKESDPLLPLAKSIADGTVVDWDAAAASSHDQRELIEQLRLLWALAQAHRDADTEIVGRSTRGNGDTGSRRNATAPASTAPIVSSVVATGRSMNGEEMFISMFRRG